MTSGRRAAQVDVVIAMRNITGSRGHPHASLVRGASESTRESTEMYRQPRLLPAAIGRVVSTIPSVAMLAIATLALPARAQQLNVICPVQAEWCNLAATEFEKETG